MKKGLYRTRIIRESEILITVTDPAVFRDYIDLETARISGGVCVDGWDDGHAIQSIACRIELGERHEVPGLTYKIVEQNVQVQPQRTCRYCGCTDYDACQMDDGLICDWDTEDCCTNPACLAAAEKEATNG